MRRREFITALTGAGVAWSRAAQAQQPPAKMRRIGVFMGIAENDAEARSCTEALGQGLRELGWTEGRNLHIDYRFTPGGPDALRASSTDLLAQQPELVVARATPVVAELQRLSSTIPIVFTLVGDPIGSGFIKSWAQPGGNITGFVNFEPSMSTKWLELLKELVPLTDQVAALYNPDTAPARGAYFLAPMENAAPLLGLKLIKAIVHNESEIESTIAKLSKPSVGLVAMPDFFTTIHRQRIVALAAQHRLPAIYPYRYFTTSGGLLSYGADTPDLFRRAATYVDRILRGARPHELPIQQPTKFQLVINLKAAKGLGLTIPPMLLALADEVIE